MPGALRLRHVHIDASRLRPYQETCLGSCLDTLKGGSTKIGIFLPTRAYKTAVSVSLLGRLQAFSGDPKATGLLVNGVELALQAADQARQIFPY